MDIEGHSGDSPVIPFYKSNTPPSTDKERLEILKVVNSSLLSDDFVLLTIAGYACTLSVLLDW